MILITGGAGYIGSHCAVEFLKDGFDVLIFDNFSTGHREIIQNIQSKYKSAVFCEGDLRNKSDTDNLFKSYKIDAVIHLAAYSIVSESFNVPEKYYENNVCATINLLNSMLENSVMNIIFSSTAAVYGEPLYLPIDEKHSKKPINPYGKTKLMIENIMDDYDIAYRLKSVRLRYFNVIGADYENGLGEWHDNETHLVPIILKSALKNDFVFKIFGKDYSTKDGTCIRDYIDVRDLVAAHKLAYYYLIKNQISDVFNIGTQKGYSVKEIYEIIVEILGKKIPVEYAPKRNGDSAVLLASAKKAENLLGWRYKKTLYESIKSAYEWEKYLTN